MKAWSHVSYPSCPSIYSSLLGMANYLVWDAKGHKKIKQNSWLCGMFAFSMNVATSIKEGSGMGLDIF